MPETLLTQKPKEAVRFSNLGPRSAVDTLKDPDNRTSFRAGFRAGALARISLRVLIPIGLLAFTLLASLLVFFESKALVQSRVEQEARAQTAHFMSELSRAVSRMISIGYAEGVGHELAVAGSIAETQSIMLSDERGLVVAASPAWLNQQPLAALEAGTGGRLATTVARVRSDQVARIEVDSGQRKLQAHHPMVIPAIAGATLPAPRVFVLSVIRDLERPQAEAMVAVRHQTARTVLVLVLLAGLAGFILDRGLTRRVERLVRAADALAAGATDVRVAFRGHDELARLGAAFDHMADAVASERTALELARRTAEDASLAKSRFLVTMSHEVRTPMNGIIGTADLLLGTPLAADQRIYVETIVRSGETLLSVINDILDLSRIEAGRTELQIHPFDVAELLEDVLSVFAASATRKGVTLAVRCAHELRSAPLLGDSVRLRQILLNLLEVSLHFTDRGRIVLAAAVSGGGCDPGGHPGEEWLEVGFEIADTGGGVPLREQEALLQPLDQGWLEDPPSATDGGLGLAITRGLIDLMGGQIALECRAGQGSLFRLRLRFQRGSLQPPAVARAQTPVASLLGRPVLVVEPDPVIRGILLEDLIALGLRADGVADAAEAWNHLTAPPGASGRPDHGGTPNSAPDVALVLASHGPGDNSVSTLARRINNELSANIPVVAISALPNLDAVAPIRPANLCGVIVRPVRRVALIDTLRRVLDGRIQLPVSIDATPSLPAATRPPGAPEAEPEPLPEVAVPATLSRDKEGYPQGSESPVAAGVPAHPAAVTDRPVRILVAEDQDFNRMVALHMLRQLGLTADWADTGAKALAMASRQAYDLILMDCHMPEMNGFEATRLIRRHETDSGHRAAIIALTADAMKGDREACLDAGMDDYLSKPVRLETLRPMLERWLRAPPIIAADPAIEVIERGKLERMRHELGDDGCEAVLASIVEDLPVRMVDLRAAVAIGDARGVASETHKIKGVARMVGASVLAQLAHAGERIGRTGSAALDEDSLSAIGDETERVGLALSAYRQGLSGTPTPHTATGSSGHWQGQATE